MGCWSFCLRMLRRKLARRQLSSPESGNYVDYACWGKPHVNWCKMLSIHSRTVMPSFFKGQGFRTFREILASGWRGELVRGRSKGFAVQAPLCEEQGLNFKSVYKSIRHVRIERNADGSVDRSIKDASFGRQNAGEQTFRG